MTTKVWSQSNINAGLTKWTQSLQETWRGRDRLTRSKANQDIEQTVLLQKKSIQNCTKKIHETVRPQKANPLQAHVCVSTQLETPKKVPELVFWLFWLELQ